MIEIKNLTKTFRTTAGTVEALKNIALTVNDGDIYGIIGMSGAEANRTIVNAGLNIKVKGVDTELPGAVAVRQSPAEGESVPPGTIITVDFLDLTTDG